MAEAEVLAAEMSSDEQPLGALGPRFNRRSPFYIGLTASAGVAVTYAAVQILGSLVLDPGPDRRGLLPGAGPGTRRLLAGPPQAAEVGGDDPGVRRVPCRHGRLRDGRHPAAVAAGHRSGAAGAAISPRGPEPLVGARPAQRPYSSAAADHRCGQRGRRVCAQRGRHRGQCRGQCGRRFVDRHRADRLLPDRHAPHPHQSLPVGAQHAAATRDPDRRRSVRQSRRLRARQCVDFADHRHRPRSSGW